MKTLKIKDHQSIHTAGDESTPQGNGFQPSADLMRAPSAAASFESKMPEPDKNEQVVTAVPSASKTKGETHDHLKAERYLLELGEKIKVEHGQETLDKLYDRVDKYQSQSSSLSTFGFNHKFGLSAGNEKTAENKEFAILIYLCLLEETHHHIESILSGKPAYAQTMQDYIKSAARSFHQLDEDGQQVIGDLYDFMGGGAY